MAVIACIVAVGGVRGLYRNGSGGQPWWQPGDACGHQSGDGGGHGHHGGGGGFSGAAATAAVAPADGSRAGARRPALACYRTLPG